MKTLKYILVLLIAATSSISCVEDENVYVEPSPWDDVTTTTINYTEGPLASISFPNNPIPGEAVNVELTFQGSDQIVEARIYWTNAIPAEYNDDVKNSKIKGENDASFTQSGVTINMLAQAQSGETTTFYARIALPDETEYYYGNDADGMHEDLSQIGGGDESDAFKDDSTKWNVFVTQ
jgi:hypothetical protein